MGKTEQRGAELHCAGLPRSGRILAVTLCKMVEGWGKSVQDVAHWRVVICHLTCILNSPSGCCVETRPGRALGLGYYLGG